MTIRGDSFSSVADVVTLTRHLLNGQTTFNSTTRPTVTEVEGFIDECSGMLNLSLRGAGFAPSAVYANSTAKQAMDSWVRLKTVSFVNFAQPYQGLNGMQDSPADLFANMLGDASKFVQSYKFALINAGISQAVKASDGLQFTGQTVQSDRSDPSDTSMEQPKFTRGMFDND